MRSLAIICLVLVSLIALLGLIVLTEQNGERVSLLASLALPVGTLATAILGAVRANAASGYAQVAADSAAGASGHALAAARAADLTASKTAAIQQAIMAHCGDICPAALCPLRPPKGVRT